MAAPDPKLPEYSYARRRGQPTVDPALRRIALAAGGVSVLVIVVALLWSGLKPGLGFGGAPPLIAAPTTPLRVVPTNPGGLTVPGANEQIMSGASDATAPRLAPATPDVNLAQLQRAANAGHADVPARPPSSAPPSAAETIPPVAQATPPQPAARRVDVQLAATHTEAAAKQLWLSLRQRVPDLLADKKPLFIPATVNGASVWRLRVPGFADQASAAAFCASLAAKGAACTVAAF